MPQVQKGKLPNTSKYHHLEDFGWHFGFPCPIIIKIYILSRQQQSKILSESHQRINQNGSYNQPSTEFWESLSWWPMLGSSCWQQFQAPDSEQNTSHLSPALWQSGTFFVDCNKNMAKKMVKKQKKSIDSHPEFHFHTGWCLKSIGNPANHLRVVGYISCHLRGLYIAPADVGFNQFRNFVEFETPP